MQKHVFCSVRNWKIHNFVFLDVAAGGRVFFSVRNRERVQKQIFIPSVTDNVCKNEISTLTCAKNCISLADVDVRNRGKKVRGFDGRASAQIFFASRWIAIRAGPAKTTFLRKPKIANANFFSVRNRRKYVKGVSPCAKLQNCGGAPFGLMLTLLVA